jgi:hypothetical protein
MNAINWKRAGLAAAVLFLTCGLRTFYPQALFNGRIATQIDRAMAMHSRRRHVVEAFDKLKNVRFLEGHALG